MIFASPPNKKKNSQKEEGQAVNLRLILDEMGRNRREQENEDKIRSLGNKINFPVHSSFKSLYCEGRIFVLEDYLDITSNNWKAGKIHQCHVLLFNDTVYFIKIHKKLLGGSEDFLFCMFFLHAKVRENTSGEKYSLQLEQMGHIVTVYFKDKTTQTTWLEEIRKNIAIQYHNDPKKHRSHMRRSVSDMRRTRSTKSEAHTEQKDDSHKATHVRGLMARSSSASDVASDTDSVLQQPLKSDVTERVRKRKKNLTVNEENLEKTERKRKSSKKGRSSAISQERKIPRRQKSSEESLDPMKATSEPIFFATGDVEGINIPPLSPLAYSEPIPLLPIEITEEPVTPRGSEGPLAFKNWTKKELEHWLLNDIKISSEDLLRINNPEFDAAGLMSAFDRNILAEELDTLGFTKEISRKIEEAVKKMNTRTKKHPRSPKKSGSIDRYSSPRQKLPSSNKSLKIFDDTLMPLKKTESSEEKRKTDRRRSDRKNGRSIKSPTPPIPVSPAGSSPVISPVMSPRSSTPKHEKSELNDRVKPSRKSRGRPATKGIPKKKNPIRISKRRIQ